MDIEVDMLAPGAERLVGGKPALEVIARGVLFGEGPVWDARGRQLFYTDIIGDTIWRWRPGAQPEPVLRPSRKANGLALDLERRLVVAGWGGRTVFRIEPDGSRTTLASHWRGRKLNSPNDVVVKSDGAIYNSALVRALRDPAVVRSMENEGAAPRPSTAAEHAARLAAEIRKWAEVVRRTGLRAN